MGYEKCYKFPQWGSALNPGCNHMFGMFRAQGTLVAADFVLFLINEV